MKQFWKSDQCYASLGVVGTDCSFQIYLSEVRSRVFEMPLLDKSTYQYSHTVQCSCICNIYMYDAHVQYMQYVYNAHVYAIYTCTMYNAHVYVHAMVPVCMNDLNCTLYAQYYVAFGKCSHY